MKISTTLFVSFILFFQANGETCNRVTSSAQDPTAAQITGGTLPSQVNELVWQRPATSIYRVAFSGTNGNAASHEGVDYVQNDQQVVEVPIYAAADGKVVYVREGCMQSSMFEHNNTARESGAGWGNHIVIQHKSAFYTRYGHLLLNSVLVNVGDSVKAGQRIATMGNSGRSETRHMHFELGTKTTDFDPCAMSQNFDRVYNSELIQYIVSSVSKTNYDLKIIPVDQDGTFRIINETSENLTHIELYNISGIQLFNSKIENADLSFHVPQKGVFILNIKGENVNLISKIVNGYPN